LNYPKSHKGNHVHPDDSDMLSVEEAQKEILSNIKVLEEKEIPLIDSTDYVLAENIIADTNIPEFNNSAMDGFGVLSIDTSNASHENPTTLNIQETIPAGKIPKNKLLKGNSVRIMTGSAIPEGCDAVVPFEFTNLPEIQEKKVKIYKNANYGENIRYFGEDIKKNDLILSKGSIINSANIGLIASLGLESIKVYRKPLISILSTGDELVSPGQDKKLGQIYDSNSYSIYSQVIENGGIPHLKKIVPDNKDSLESAFLDCSESDLVITTAGVSKGDFDYVKDTIKKMGEINFWSVRMRPGKPLTFGLLNYNKKQIPHIGLPGNPVSAIVGFEIFVRPVIKSMIGIKEIYRKQLTATLNDPIYNYDQRKVFARVTVKGNPNQGYYANITGDQNSHILSSISKANGLAICPENIKLLKKGDQVKVLMLNSEIL
jgi:molybdopterin molybdotransferase